MKCSLAVAVLAFAFFISCACADHDCSGVMKSFLGKILEIVESGEGECVKKLELVDQIERMHKYGDDRERFVGVVLPEFAAFLKSRNDVGGMEASECVRGQIFPKAKSAMNLPGNCRETLDKEIDEFHGQVMNLLEN